MPIFVCSHLFFQKLLDFSSLSNLSFDSDYFIIQSLWRKSK